MCCRPTKVILDYDGTLTAEEDQVGELAERVITTLAEEILLVARPRVAEDYERTREMLLATPHAFCWEVNGLCASYCDEGAFILNTTTLQVMLRSDPNYLRSVSAFLGDEVEYDPVVDCTNYLFHRCTYDLVPRFRDDARRVLIRLLEHPSLEPVVLTSSRGDKVTKNLRTLQLGEIRVLGDTRQYDMDPSFDVGAGLGLASEFLSVDQLHRIDLRRPAYVRALGDEGSKSEWIVVADTLSMPGALPLALGHRFLLLRTSYTPAWCEAFVRSHPLGIVIEHLDELPAWLQEDSAFPTGG